MHQNNKKKFEPIQNSYDLFVEQNQNRLLFWEKVGKLKTKTSQSLCEIHAAYSENDYRKSRLIQRLMK